MNSVLDSQIVHAMGGLPIPPGAKVIDQIDKDAVPSSDVIRFCRILSA